jgi:hypothetical protein
VAHLGATRIAAKYSTAEEKKAKDQALESRLANLQVQMLLIYTSLLIMQYSPIPCPCTDSLYRGAFSRYGEVHSAQGQYSLR